MRAARTPAGSPAGAVGRLLGTITAAAAVLAMAVACGSDDPDPTGYGDFVTDPEQLAEMITAAQADGDAVYCSLPGSAEEKTLQAWLRGQDDFQLLAGKQLGMSRDDQAVTLWDTDSATALELLNQEAQSMGLDSKSISSAAVFDSMLATSRAGALPENQNLRCRHLDEQAWPALTGVTVYTMGDLASGEMSQEQAEQMFASFEQF